MLVVTDVSVDRIVAIEVVRVCGTIDDVSVYVDAEEPAEVRASSELNQLVPFCN